MATNNQWQDTCARGLLDALNIGGGAGRLQWSVLRQQWLTQGESRVTLIDLDLTERDLRGYDLTRCWIGRTRFVRANLSGADFSQSIFRGCEFDGANIRKASFNDSDLSDEAASGPNRMTNIRFDRATDMEVRRGMLASAMDQALKDFANTAWRRTDWLNRRSRSPVYRFLTFTTDYGFGVGRFFVVALSVVVCFSGIFYFATSHLTDRKVTFAESFLNSMRYFIALSDPYETIHPILSALGILEASLGLVALAMLIAIFANKFTDI
jgi:uncharacterized protein YjbI with pentapeptide repeats